MLEYILFLDNHILELVVASREPLLDFIFKLITFLGDAPSVIVITALFSLWAVNKKRPDLFISLLVSLVASEVVGNIIKLLVARPRPDQALWLVSEQGYSFPSNHSMISMAFFGLIAYCAFKYVKTWSRNLIGTLFVIEAMLLPMSRVYLGVHYPIDAIAGWTLGAIVMVWVVRDMERPTSFISTFKSKFSRQNP